MTLVMYKNTLTKTMTSAIRRSLILTSDSSPTGWYDEDLWYDWAKWYDGVRWYWHLTGNAHAVLPDIELSGDWTFSASFVVTESPENNPLFGGNPEDQYYIGLIPDNGIRFWVAGVNYDFFPSTIYTNGSIHTVKFQLIGNQLICKLNNTIIGIRTIVPYTGTNTAVFGAVTY